MRLIPDDALKKIKRQIESRFPEMKGVEPSAEKLALKPEPALYEKLGLPLPKVRGSKDVIRLHFSTKVAAEDGSEIRRIVRVLVDSSGAILKITTSK
jgi:hypothetical protein